MIDAQMDVRTVEAANEDGGVGKSQALDNFRPYIKSGCGRHGKYGGAPKLLDYVPESQVAWPEVVPPFCDAMRLIDNEERGFRIFQAIDGFLLAQLLRSEKDEFDLAVIDLLESF